MNTPGPTTAFEVVKTVGLALPEGRGHDELGWLTCLRVRSYFIAGWRPIARPSLARSWSDALLMTERGSWRTRLTRDYVSDYYRPYPMVLVRLSHIHQDAPRFALCFVALGRGEGAEAYATRRSLDSGPSLTFTTGCRAISRGHASHVGADLRTVRRASASLFPRDRRSPTFVHNHARLGMVVNPTKLGFASKSRSIITVSVRDHRCESRLQSVQGASVPTARIPGGSPDAGPYASPVLSDSANNDGRICVALGARWDARRGRGKRGSDPTPTAGGVAPPWFGKSTNDAGSEMNSTSAG